MRLDQRASLVGGEHRRRHPLRQQGAEAALVGVVDEGVQEADRDSLVAGRVDVVADPTRLVLVQRSVHAPVGPHALPDLEDVAAAQQRLRLGHAQIVGLVALLATDEQDVAEAPGGDERRSGPLALDDRVRRDGGRVQHRRDGRCPRPMLPEYPAEPGQNGFAGVVGGRGHLAETHAPRAVVHQDEVRERSSDVERDSDHSVRAFPAGCDQRRLDL